jgi:hypothetical protein
VLISPSDFAIDPRHGERKKIKEHAGSMTMQHWEMLSGVLHKIGALA